MPRYTVTADIFNVVSQKVVAELTDDTTGLSPDNGKIDSALERAESVVDSYVGKVYSVPLTTPVLPSIKHAVLTLARCYLFTRRPGVMPDEIKEACEETIQWLKDVSTRTIELDDVVTVSALSDSSADDELFTKMVF